jgi:hypothetical protein
MKEGLPEGVTRDQVLHEVEGLRSSCTLLREIETGNMPNSTWSSGEKDFKRDAKGQVMHDKDGKIIFGPVALPIYGVTPRDTHCLSYGVKRAIGSRLQMLTEWGGHDEAMEMIREYQLKPKGVIYERQS